MFRPSETTTEPSQNRFRRASIQMLVATAICAVAGGAWANGTADALPEDTPALRIVATVGMLGDVAARVGGDCAEVVTMMGPGIDPHLYQPRASDVRALQDADLILYVGLQLEGQLGDVLGRFGRQKATVAVGAESVPPEERLADPDAPDSPDPHVWMDPRHWAGAADVIANAIVQQRPTCERHVRSGAASFRDRAHALHDWIASAVATIPSERRVLITAHDAFGYYGHAYGMDVVGIQGISTDAEPSIADIRAVADLLIERAVPALFLESTLGTRTVQAVLDAARERGHDARLGGTLYGDAMGEAGTAAGSYLGMMHANTVAITRALGGTVPPLPDALAPWAEANGIDVVGEE
ncbi:MAG: zinc ABC transporter substrate-binding protein [Trueperaceae bacterium]